jgi:NADH:ubiquinone oxidoreductase subunit 2 (subunit N)
MRWKLLGLVSVIGALFSVALWSAAAIAVFGSAGAMARNDWALVASLVIPLGVSIFAALFAYRHTAHRRKTQAVLVTILTLLLAGATYLVASSVFVSRLYIPTTNEMRHAR